MGNSSRSRIGTFQPGTLVTHRSAAGWLVAGIAAVWLGQLTCRPERPTFPSSADLMPEILAIRRWIEPRLTGGTRYGRCVAECPNRGLLCEPACPETGSVSHNLPQLVSLWEDGDRAEQHAAAVVRLISERELSNAEEAVAVLERLAEQTPGDARILSDLAAAYIVVAERGNQPQKLTLALTAAEQALEIDPSLVESRFNRALASSRLALWPDATVAWSAYLELDSDSEWAEEAGQWRREATNLPNAAQRWAREEDTLAAVVRDLSGAALRERLDPYRTAARRWVLNEVLPAWAEAASEGRIEAAEESLLTAGKVAEALVELGGDRLLLDAVAVIRGASRQRRGALIEGHRAHGQALKQYESFETRKAMENYRRASQALAWAGSPVRAWSEVGLALCLYQEHELPEALELLTALREEAERHDYGSLAGRVAWIIGLCQDYSNLPTEARSSYRAAVDSFRGVGERESVASVQALLAELCQWGLGDGEAGWRHRLQAFSGFPHLVEPRRKFYILFEAAQAIHRELPRIARELQREALRIARLAEEDPVYLAVALRGYASANLGSGDPQQALSDLAAAFDHSGRVPNPAVRRVIQARIREVEGLLVHEHDLVGSIESFTAALELLPQEEYRGYRARLYLQRGTSHLKAGQRRAALRDLAASVEEIDAEWRQVLDKRRPGEHEGIWSAYFDQRQETFDRLVGLQVDMGLEGEALTSSEKGRARDLLDLVADVPSVRPTPQGPFHPLRAQDLVAGVPAGTVLVEYALLDDRLLVWVIRRHQDVRLHVLDLERRAVDEAVAQVTGAAADREADLDPEALRWLHATLVEPVLETSKVGEKLVFVPDDSIHGVPFAALRDASGRFLVQDHPIAVAPSATLYLYAEGRARELPGRKPPHALVVGDPEFQGHVYPGLDPLPGAALESREVAELYPGAELLLGREATKEEFLRLLGGYDIVHFAGHSVSNPADPNRSLLVLGSSGSGAASGTLYAAELLGRDLPRPRLFVLSACSTAGGHDIGSLGVSSLVRPILGAGVPAVVGSLWDTSDPATRHLLTEFHRRFSAGTDVATALQEAQIALLEGESRGLGAVFSWAPFQVIGAANLGPSIDKEE